MMVCFLLRIVVLIVSVGCMNGMDDLEKAQKALMIWRMQKIYHIERPLPSFAFQDITGSLEQMSVKKSLHTSSFFSKHLQQFFMQRAWKYAKYNTQGCLFQYEYVQPHFDILDLASKEITVGSLPIEHFSDAYQSFSEGVWYLNPNHNVEQAKDAMRLEVAHFLRKHQEKSLKLEHVRFSDDYLHMVCLMVGDEQDYVLLFHPAMPLCFDKVTKLADCFVRCI